MVPDALPDAERVRVSSRLQGVVLESTHRHGRGQRGVQRKSHPGNIARKPEIFPRLFLRFNILRKYGKTIVQPER